ncbi:hypothetical protein BGZ93_009239 [Podila epicladia]|nr:hypothetical protein BGZ93_009239 [Podila epicladia]
MKITTAVSAVAVATLAFVSSSQAAAVSCYKLCLANHAGTPAECANKICVDWGCVNICKKQGERSSDCIDCKFPGNE